LLAKGGVLAQSLEKLAAKLIGKNEPEHAVKGDWISSFGWFNRRAAAE
jgi:hypothetical protein